VLYELTLVPVIILYYSYNACWTNRESKPLPFTDFGRAGVIQ